MAPRKKTAAVRGRLAATSGQSNYVRESSRRTRPTPEASVNDHSSTSTPSSRHAAATPPRRPTAPAVSPDQRTSVPSPSSLSDKENLPTLIDHASPSAGASFDGLDASESSHPERPLHSTPIQNLSSDASRRSSAPKSARVLRPLRVAPSGEVTDQDTAPGDTLFADASTSRVPAFLDEHFNRRSADSVQSADFQANAEEALAHADQYAAHKAVPWISAVERERLQPSQGIESPAVEDQSVHSLSQDEDDPFGFDAAWRAMGPAANRGGRAREGLDERDGEHATADDVSALADLEQSAAGSSPTLPASAAAAAATDSAGGSGDARTSRRDKLAKAIVPSRTTRSTARTSSSLRDSSPLSGAVTPMKRRSGGASSSAHEASSPSAILAAAVDHGGRRRTGTVAAALDRKNKKPSASSSSAKAKGSRPTQQPRTQQPSARPTRAAATRATKKRDAKIFSSDVDESDSLASSSDEPEPVSSRRRGQPLANKNIRGKTTSAAVRTRKVKSKESTSAPEHTAKSKSTASDTKKGRSRKRTADGDAKEESPSSESSLVRNEREKRLKAYRDLDDFELEEEQVW